MIMIPRMTAEDAFWFELVARGRGNGCSRWRVIHDVRPPSIVVATVDLVPEAQEWRLRSADPALPPRSASWSHNGQPVRNHVHAWVRREVIATLLAWALEVLRDRDAADRAGGPA